CDLLGVIDVVRLHDPPVPRREQEIVNHREQTEVVGIEDTLAQCTEQSCAYDIAPLVDAVPDIALTRTAEDLPAWPIRITRDDFRIASSVGGAAGHLAAVIDRKGERVGPAGGPAQQIKTAGRRPAKCLETQI